MAMSPSMTVLKLEGEGDDWRLHLDGDWSLAAMAQIETQLRVLPGGLHGTLVCDWSRAEAPGIGPAWALLMRLADIGTRHFDVRHTGDPPHFLELLQKLKKERQAAPAAPETAASLEHSVGEVGRWAVLQGTEGRAVIGFFGRLVTVLREAFSRTRGLRQRPGERPAADRKTTRLN